MERTKIAYSTPELRVLEVNVENGIAQSTVSFGSPGGAGNFMVENPDNVYDF